MFDKKLNLSGERFRVAYSLVGSENEAYAAAEGVCVEQTIEFPAELVSGGDIRDFLLGRIESFRSLETNRWLAEISYAVEATAFELTQLLNVVFGNTSLKPGIRVEELELCRPLLETFKGPRFGVPGLREKLDAPRRPLFCAILKPMGLSAGQLADMAYKYALGGADLIKEDHGLTDQPFAPFKERVEQCAAAIERANRETGDKCLYVPNITAPAHRVVERALFAKEKGAGGMLLAPGLVGFDTLRLLAENERIALPVVCHPAFQGTYVVSPQSGVSPYVLFGQLPRLAGADAVIFANYGGRFSFSKEDCRGITRAASAPMRHIKSIFTVPGGGVSLQRIPEMVETYGRDLIFLVGGALHQAGPDLVENCRRYKEAIME